MRVDRSVVAACPGVSYVFFSITAKRERDGVFNGGIFIGVKFIEIGVTSEGE